MKFIAQGNSTDNFLCRFKFSELNHKKYLSEQPDTDADKTEMKLLYQKSTYNE